jgi:hypothetical protein
MAGLLDFLGSGAQGLGGLWGMPGQLGGMGLHQLQALGLLSGGQQMPMQPQQAPFSGGIGNDFGSPQMPQAAPQPAPADPTADGTIDPVTVNSGGPPQAPKLPMAAPNYEMPTLQNVHVNPLAVLARAIIHGETPGEASLAEHQQALAPAMAQFQANQYAQQDASLTPQQKILFRAMGPQGYNALIAKRAETGLKDGEGLPNIGEPGIETLNAKTIATAPGDGLATQKLNSDGSVGVTQSGGLNGKPLFSDPVFRNGVWQKLNNATNNWEAAPGLGTKDQFEMNNTAVQTGMAKQKQNVENTNALFNVPQFEQHQTSAALMRDLTNAALKPGGVSDAVIREATARIATKGKATQFSSNMFDDAQGPLAKLKQFAPGILSGQKLTPEARQAMMEFVHDSALQDRQAYINRVAPVVKAYKENGLPVPDINSSLSEIPEVPGMGQIPRGMGVVHGEPSAAKAAPRSAPPVGFVSKGWRFRGGDPAQPTSWEPAH